ncbi:MAG: putative porin, partial [Desulfatiglandaceae bacterium]
TDVDRETTGYQLGIEVGHPAVRDFLDWNVFLYYKYLEADAVVDAFTDSDFHDGGTNAKGWILGGEVGLYHNVSGRIRWLTTDEISGPPLAIDTLQMDINARF